MINNNREEEGEEIEIKEKQQDETFKTGNIKYNDKTVEIKDNTNNNMIKLYVSTDLQKITINNKVKYDNNIIIDTTGIEVAGNIEIEELTVKSINIGSMRIIEEDNKVKLKINNNEYLNIDHETVDAKEQEVITIPQIIEINSLIVDNNVISNITKINSELILDETNNHLKVDDKIRLNTTLKLSNASITTYISGYITDNMNNIKIYFMDTGDLKIDSNTNKTIYIGAMNSTNLKVNGSIYLNNEYRIKVEGTEIILEKTNNTKYGCYIDMLKVGNKISVVELVTQNINISNTGTTNTFNVNKGIIGENYNETGEKGGFFINRYGELIVINTEIGSSIDYEYGRRLYIGTDTYKLNFILHGDFTTNRLNINRNIELMIKSAYDGSILHFRTPTNSYISYIGMFSSIINRSTNNGIRLLIGGYDNNLVWKSDSYSGQVSNTSMTFDSHTITHTTLIDEELTKYKYGIPVFSGEKICTTKYEALSRDIKQYTTQTIEDISDDCITSVKTEGDETNFVGIVTNISTYDKTSKKYKINQHIKGEFYTTQPVIQYATHGDYIFKIPDNKNIISKDKTRIRVKTTYNTEKYYEIGDEILYDGRVLVTLIDTREEYDNTKTRTKIEQTYNKYYKLKYKNMTIGRITRIINSNYVAVFRK